MRKESSRPTSLFFVAHDGASLSRYSLTPLSTSGLMFTSRYNPCVFSQAIIETTKLGAQILLPNLQEQAEILFELLPQQMSTLGQTSKGNVGSIISSE